MRSGELPNMDCVLGDISVLKFVLQGKLLGVRKVLRASKQHSSTVFTEFVTWKGELK